MTDNIQQGYHITEIEKGVYGEASKIKEEVDEFLDAECQGAKLMALHELSDLYGAMAAYLRKYYPTFTMEDLEIMSSITKRAFESSHRK